MMILRVINVFQRVSIARASVALESYTALEGLGLKEYGRRRFLMFISKSDKNSSSEVTEMGLSSTYSGMMTNSPLIS